MVAGTPVWSPDGSKIAFTSDKSGNIDIWVIDADGSNMRQVTRHPAWDDFPSWSSDGRKIAFQSDRAGTIDIWAIDIKTGRTEQITNFSSDEYLPDWSPDMRWIAFASNKDTGLFSMRIWAMNIDTKKAILVSRGNGTIEQYPAWSPDGSMIAYTSNGYDGHPDGDSNIWVAQVEFVSLDGE
jgi:TolB protein